MLFLQAPVIVSVKVADAHTTPSTKPPRPTINTVPEIARLPYREKLILRAGEAILATTGTQACVSRSGKCSSYNTKEMPIKLT